MKPRTIVRVIMGTAASLGSLVGQSIFVPGGTVGTSSDGNVGIGTTNPAQGLDVQKSNSPVQQWSSGTSGNFLQVGNANDGTNQYWYFALGPSTTDEYIFYNFQSGSSRGVAVRNAGGNWNRLSMFHNDAYGGLQTSGLTPLALQPNGGNVAIGATNPVAKLQSTGASQVAGPTLGIPTGGALLLTNTDPAYGLLAGVAPDGDAWEQAERVDGGAVAYSILLQPSGGYVGIGTTNPRAELDVSGGARVGGGAYLTDLAHQGTYLDAGNSGFRGTYTNYTTPWGVTSVGTTYGVTFDGTDNQWEYVIGSGNTYGGALVFDLGSGSFYFMNTGASSGSNGMSAQSALTTRFLVDKNGNVGIGTNTPAYPLSVNGTVRAKEVIVDTGWSDYVFDPSYHLMPLEQLGAYVDANRHLPGIPTAKEIKAQGISVGNMQAKLLRQVEELTLRVIDEGKYAKEQSELLKAQQIEIGELRAEVARLSKHN